MVRQQSKFIKKCVICEERPRNLSSTTWMKLSDDILTLQCDGCGISPISGTRWHCIDCSKDAGVDFCTECAERLVL